MFILSALGERGSFHFAKVLIFNEMCNTLGYFIDCYLLRQLAVTPVTAAADGPPLAGVAYETVTLFKCCNNLSNFLN
jgi:hypothetical protein